MGEGAAGEGRTTAEVGEGVVRRKGEAEEVAARSHTRFHRHWPRKSTASPF